MLLIVLLIVGLSLVGIGCLYFGLRGASQMDFVGSVLLGATILLVGAVAYVYFTSHALTFEPDNASSSVSQAPGP
jgi:hypothetical protein